MKRNLILITAIIIASITSSQASIKPWSVRMVESEMIRNPHPTYLDNMKGVMKWNYTTGLELLAILDVYDRYDDKHMLDYVLSYADTIINDKGEIYNYKKSNYNIDHVCPGRMLFRLYERTDNQKYRRAMAALRTQLAEQPRTSEGGFWHKQVYPNQMWLDGLYMGSPFYGEYARRFDRGDVQKQAFDDIVNQFITVGKHTYDPSSGLYRHAWDEKHEQPWADPTTGQSAHVWGRALGWYAMGLVETLDYIPKDHAERGKMIEILQNIYTALPKYQDKETGMWYQVLDQPDRKGNYQEATCSAMFVYTMLKAIRKGYLDGSLLPQAIKNYNDLIKTFVKENPDGTISLTQCCEVAGLGGKTGRDGSFDYYISEPIRDNDAKGVGPFIWASLEYEALNNIDFIPVGFEAGVSAFPGAEGGGMYTSGGRGGRAIYVTKLTDDGSEGTLRHAIEQKGPRTILFAVSGNIELTETLEIKNGDLTIAGHSAPGEGICIKDFGVELKADNVIIRYMRFRMGDLKKNQTDALEGQNNKNIIIDHCSISWSTDECASFYANSNFTMQWCIISESLNTSVHKKGKHGYGAIWGGHNATFHHNLLAHHTSRNPRLDHPAIYPDNQLISNRGSVEYVNNLVYNWGQTASYGGETGWWNIIGNYYKAGPASKKATTQFFEASISEITVMQPGKFYIKDNILVGSDPITTNNWQGVAIKGEFKRSDIETAKPYEVRGTLTIEPATQAYKNILSHSGASLHRDAIDSRIVDETTNGTATYKGSVSQISGVIDSQNDVGGWVELKSLPIPKDSDGDGIPDRWETKNKLDPKSVDDGSRYAKGERYTNLERYLNSLVPARK